MNKKTIILYVDDEPINVEVFELNFEEKYTVFTAGSGIEGLEILKSYSEIEVVITDLKMPEMNGVEFIKKARQIRPNIIFFLLTGYEISDEISKNIQEKVVDRYFRKPFDMIEIEIAIEMALK